jgi:hypothetical protein
LAFSLFDCTNRSIIHNGLQLAKLDFSLFHRAVRLDGRLIIIEGHSSEIVGWRAFITLPHVCVDGVLLCLLEIAEGS